MIDSEYKVGDVVNVREWRRYPWMRRTWNRLLGRPTGEYFDARYVCVGHGSYLDQFSNHMGDAPLLITVDEVLNAAAHFGVRPSPPTAPGDHHGP